MGGGEYVTKHDTSLEARKQRGRIWIDGCFDFAHHGHAGAILQARRLGTELYVGVHSDEEIMANKGPTVMNLDERIAAVDACRWTTRSIPTAPYVTQLEFIDRYDSRYVVHGDDITSDSGGEDCYRFVKQAGRFLVVKRTPGISTTDLVGRMLLCTKGHFIRSLGDVLDGAEGGGSREERLSKGEEMRARIMEYASDETGLDAGVEVYGWRASGEVKVALAVSEGMSTMEGGSSTAQTQAQGGQTTVVPAEAGEFSKMVWGKSPRPGQRVVYVDGGFDLFSSGHIEFLRQVSLKEEELGRERGWYDEDARKKRVQKFGEDYGPAYVVAGVHDDEVINHWKGVNYPIMNIFERGLCVLQCRYIHSLILGAPFTPSSAFLHSLPYNLPAAVYHGPTSFMPLTYDPYAEAKALGIFQEVGSHTFQHVNAAEIVERIMKSRALYEERQRKKGEKSVGEEAVRRREQMEREAKALEEERRKEVERSQ